jgi:hypothetical protein
MVDAENCTYFVANAPSVMGTTISAVLKFVLG